MTVNQRPTYGRLAVKPVALVSTLVLVACTKDVEMSGFGDGGAASAGGGGSAVSGGGTAETGDSHGDTGLGDDGADDTGALDSGSTSEATDDDDGGPGIKLDVGSPDPINPGCGEGSGGGGLEEVAFSNIWIANSPEGTVSKIDTTTGMELGRYRTGPANTTNPSRTSVNLVGDVAVLNRGDSGAILKIVAEPDRCIDQDGDGQIRTSTGPNDVLGWGQDECVEWSVDLHDGARAVAWDSGNDPEAEDCAGEPSVWVSAMDAAKTIHIWRLAGDTGTIEDQTTIPGWAGSVEWGGLYGGAVDIERNFWAIGKDDPALFRVDFVTMDVTRWDAPAGISRLYSIAMDKEGNPHVTAEFDNQLLRFDVQSETWEVLANVNGTLRGLAVAKNGDVWIATNQTCGVAHYDHQSGQVTSMGLPECNVPVGVSIDVDDYVWVVDQWAGAPPFGRAHKIHPTTSAIEVTVSGLNTPYTYSDMTGAGLNLVSFPPQG